MSFWCNRRCKINEFQKNNVDIYLVRFKRICPARGSTLNQISGSAASTAQIKSMSIRRVMAIRFDVMLGRH